MIDISIPPEVLEAGARAICEMEYGACDGGDTNPCSCTYWAAHARTSFEAMVAEWPGMDTIMLPRMMQPGHFVPQDYIRLPLTEKQDDKA